MSALPKLHAVIGPAAAAERDVRHAAARYISLGWYPIPLSPGTKEPFDRDWLDRVYVPADFKPNDNIGLRLVDKADARALKVVAIDFDAPEIHPGVVREFLGPLGDTAGWGRGSKSVSQLLYEAPFEKLIALKDLAAASTTDKATLVEIRTGKHQSMCPPSIHPSGEQLQWLSDRREPLSVEPERLRRAVNLVATYALLARYWPASGARHDWTLAVAGCLRNLSVTSEEAERLVRLATQHAGDPNGHDRVTEVRKTYEKPEQAHLAGAGRLADLMGDAGRSFTESLRKVWGAPEALPVLSRDVAVLATRGEIEDAFPLTESGDGEFFAQLYRDDVRFDHARDRWLRFDGTRWAPQAKGEIDRLALDATRARQAAALRISETEKRKRHLDWAIKGESAGRRRRLLELARLEEPLADVGDKWDSERLLLGVPNGVVDLSTGELRAGRPEDRITMQTAAPFDPEARSELLERVLCHALPDESVRVFLQKAAGLTLAGEVGENVLILMRGGTRTSKGTLQEAISNALGDYAVNSSLGLLAEREERGAPRPDLMRLRGARMVSIYESSKQLRLAAALVKTITGSDPIAARNLYEKEITFKPQFLLWLATNLRPQAPNDDDALWERIREVPFLVHIAQHERDPSVRRDLADPAKNGAAILAWAWHGWRRYQQEGLGQPAAVKAATAEYRGEMDPVGEYLNRCCVLMVEGEPKSRPWISARELRKDYERWCEESGVAPVDAKTLAASLTARGCQPGQRQNQRGWLGVGVSSGVFS